MPSIRIPGRIPSELWVAICVAADRVGLHPIDWIRQAIARALRESEAAGRPSQAPNDPDYR